ncbi:hypothetical protein QVD17_27885 [Tagetes erecta]|uniref:NB-ARC n=1 Tax=Tagetes erecta TaxID=13708 RepID=A0AAD8K9T5_TARER|nr:hypothetical protein QVD17_27885 [Tagetes erecta]
MAAETVAGALLQVIFEKLADEALKRYARAQGIYSELENLGTELSHIQALLNDASDKEIKEGAVKLWLNDLQHLAYDIDDVLDDVATEAMHHELTLESGAITSKVRKLIAPTCCTNLSLSHRLSPTLDRITIELRHLEKRKEGLRLIKKDGKTKYKRGTETSLLEPDLVGRQGEKEKLLNKLFGGESSTENFSIIPIVGMGGVGKTTLARLLYNDTQVNDHFELKAWVCISDDFDTFKISGTILQCVTGENKEFKDLNQLQLALAEVFKDKLFLLVVDDVWSENYNDWEILVRPFRSCTPGSRIIMTTRKEELLKMLGFDHLDHLESLSNKDALSLLALHALGAENFDLHPTLRPKGEGIVGRCCGLPLALKAIGRLLRTKIEKDWDDVLDSEIWDIKDGGEIVPALRLSYHDLSADLKQLFAYCSLFPKDFVFDRDDLVLLWMAEGYLNRSPTKKPPECLGQENFKKLLSLSFFQYAPNDKSFFIMHDLMNDMANFVAREYFLRFEKKTDMMEETLAKYRHLSFIREEYVGYQKFKAFERATSLRTLLPVFAGVEQSWDQFYISNKTLDNLIHKLLLLRVLSLRRFNISEVPEFIGKLKHLRYLNLSQTKIKVIPESVGNLYNLQTLILFGCERLTQLPKSFTKLKKLRHFDIKDTPLLKKLPMGISELRSLRTLSKIIIGKEDGFAIAKLKGFENLQGELSLRGLHNVQSARHSQEVNLFLRRLTKLELKWDDDSQRGTRVIEFLNELKPHNDTLKSLGIELYAGIEFPCWVGDPSFRQLGHVSIRGCRKCTSIPPLGQLPSLKELIIQGMDEVRVIGIELTQTITVAFPSLEVLEFEDMMEWEAWSTNNEVVDVVFPCLRELYIKKCPKLSNISLDALPLLRLLEINECGDCVLRSVVRAASSITKLNITSIAGLTNEVWKGVMKNLGEVEEVSLAECNEIRYLWESEVETSKVLVNLKKLSVKYCDNLVSFGVKEEDDHFRCIFLSSLMVLEIRNCKKIECCCCPNSIENLIICDCESLANLSFPATPERWKKLKLLHLFDCKKLLELIDYTNMPMLNDLRIMNCPSMDTSFSRGLWPPNLIILAVGRLKKPMSDWGPQYFPASLVALILLGESNVGNIGQLSHLLPSSLTHLWIRGFDKLESVSMGLQRLTSLHHLIIDNCTKMKHLQEETLTSLHHLQISFCPKIKHFSKTVLPSLLSLRIYGCPKLEKRYNGRGSHYWPQISHIPCIDMDLRYINDWLERKRKQRAYVETLSQ